MADTTPPSPDGLQLRGAPASSARLNKKAALIAVAALGLILGVIVMNVSKDKPKAVAEDSGSKKDLEPALNAAKTLTKDVPDVVAAPPPPRQVPALPPAGGTGSGPALAPVRSSADEARLADSGVPKFSGNQTAGIQPAVAGATYEAPSLPANGLVGAGSAAQLAAQQAANNPPDLNHQDQKLAFLRQTPQGSQYLNTRLAAPVSPFELKTGTVIPSVLIGEMNSDLPGEIIAQVAQNVYDTASGRHLLIPQGTRLFGRYDSQVSFGQERALVSWQRLIYPNAATVELGGMPGDDQGGNAGLADQVNNHYGRIFGWAALTSVLSAGAQLSQPQQSNSLVPSNGQVAAAAVGQQMAELGAEIARRNMQVQPTITIRKGYRLNVMVTKDVIFPGSYQP